MKGAYDDWDQNIKTLGTMLFPDPSKAAHAYYYGSEARKAQLQSNTLIDQQHHRNDYDMMSRGLPVASPTFQQPTNVPGAAPIRAPAANLPMVGAPGGSPLSALPNMTPQQAADMIPAAIQPYTTGTPAPFGPPSAVSPPAPQTTTSNGQQPQNDYTSGQLHPESINTTGVRVQASPAAANGSPAAVPPGMTLPGLLAMHGAGALAGIDAATLAGGGQALAYELFDRKIINEDRFKKMLGGTGATQPMVADIQAAAAIKGHEIGAGATLGAARIREAEARFQFENALEKTIDANGNVVYTPRKGAVGQRAFDSPLAVAQENNAGAVQHVQPGGLGTAIYPQRADAAIKNQSRLALPTVENTIAAEDAKYGVFTSPDDPMLRIPTTQGRAREAGLVPVPASRDQQISMLDDAIVRTTDPAKQQALLDRKLALAAIPTGPVEAKEADAQRQVDYRILQEAYPQPDPITAVDLTVKDPVALKPEAETAVRDRVTALQRPSGDKRLALNATAARLEAIRQLQNEGVLYTPDEINAMRREDIRSLAGRDVRIMNHAPVGKPAAPHMMIGLKPKPGEVATTTAEPISTTPGLTPKPPIVNRQIRVPPKTTAAPPATTAPQAGPTAATPAGPPPGATMKVPAGTPDGPFRLSTGEVGTALGGYYIPPTR